MWFFNIFLDVIGITKKKPESRTSQLLTSIFGHDDELIQMYCTTREKFKQNKKLYSDKMMDVTARLEVKLGIEREKVEIQIKEMENGAMAE